MLSEHHKNILRIEAHNSAEIWLLKLQKISFNKPSLELIDWAGESSWENCRTLIADRIFWNSGSKVFKKAFQEYVLAHTQKEESGGTQDRA